MILVASGDERGPTVAASRGYDGGRTGAEIPLGQGVLGVRAARPRRHCAHGQCRDAAAYLAGVRARTEAAGQATLEPAVEMPRLADAQSQLAIPLIVKDRLVGDLGVESATANAFDELDEMLLSIVGNQVATGIDNARMHLSLSSAPASSTPPTPSCRVSTKRWRPCSGAHGGALCRARSCPAREGVERDLAAPHGATRGDPADAAGQAIGAAARRGGNVHRCGRLHSI